MAPALLAISIAYYWVWSANHLALLGASIAMNFVAAQTIARTRGGVAGAVLTVAIVANLAVLGLFKYADFAIGFWNDTTGAGVLRLGLVLPLGISFYSLQQIAYLVDVRTRRTKPLTASRYALFVLFFPQLVAGPIVSGAWFAPRIRRLMSGRRLKRRLVGLARGASWFALGLAKKTIIADGLGAHIDLIYAEAAAHGVGALDAWTAAIGYGLQLYFDFSGYCDMAIGLGLAFGLRLPTNFDAPYRARSVREFWRRWNMTLSHFLRDHIYVPLGGSRQGFSREIAALMATMVIGGLWHGAAFGFLIWGLLHGSYMVVERVGRGVGLKAPGPVARIAALVAIMFAWLFFRADTTETALEMAGAALGSVGLGATPSLMALLWVGVAGGLAMIEIPPHVLLSPRRREPRRRLGSIALPMWRPGPVQAVMAAALIAVSVWRMGVASPFLYFQF